MHSRHNIFDPLPKCAWCGAEFTPSPGSSGKYCSVEHSDEARRNRIPDSWAQIHAYMLRYQKQNDYPPSIGEIVMNSSLTSKSSVHNALKKMAARKLMEVTKEANFGRRYRAKGTFPTRQPA